MRGVFVWVGVACLRKCEQCMMYRERDIGYVFVFSKGV